MLDQALEPLAETQLLQLNRCINQQINPENSSNPEQLRLWATHASGNNAPKPDISLYPIDPAESLNISYSIQSSRWGPLLIAESETGYCTISFLDDQTESTAERILRSEWKQASITRQQLDTHHHLAERLSNLITPTCVLHVAGTPFQQKVWRQLLSISKGELTTYGQIATRLELPNGARAVGSAVAQNPIAVLIPCHRVVRSDGALGGYRWHEQRKQQLLYQELVT